MQCGTVCAVIWYRLPDCRRDVLSNPWRTVLVQTINELSTGQIQLVVLADGAIAAGTIVIVKARCTI